MRNPNFSVRFSVRKSGVSEVASTNVNVQADLPKPIPTIYDRLLEDKDDAP